MKKIGGGVGEAVEEFASVDGEQASDEGGGRDDDEGPRAPAGATVEEDQPDGEADEQRQGTTAGAGEDRQREGEEDAGENKNAVGAAPEIGDGGGAARGLQRVPGTENPTAGEEGRGDDPTGEMVAIREGAGAAFGREHPVSGH